MSETMPINITWIRTVANTSRDFSIKVLVFYYDVNWHVLKYQNAAVSDKTARYYIKHVNATNIVATKPVCPTNLLLF